MQFWQSQAPFAFGVLLSTLPYKSSFDTIMADEEVEEVEGVSGVGDAQVAQAGRASRRSKFITIVVDLGARGRR